MKFYRYGHYVNSSYLERKKITCIYINNSTIIFFKNGKYHNNKNVAYFNYFNNFKEFWLNGKIYGTEYKFTKQSWRRFFKMQTFL